MSAVLPLSEAFYTKKLRPHAIWNNALGVMHRWRFVNNETNEKTIYPYCRSLKLVEDVLLQPTLTLG